MPDVSRAKSYPAFYPLLFACGRLVAAATYLAKPRFVDSAVAKCLSSFRIELSPAQGLPKSRLAGQAVAQQGAQAEDAFGALDQTASLQVVAASLQVMTA